MSTTPGTCFLANRNSATPKSSGGGVKKEHYLDGQIPGGIPFHSPITPTDRDPFSVSTHLNHLSAMTQVRGRPLDIFRKLYACKITSYTVRGGPFDILFLEKKLVLKIKKKYSSPEGKNKNSLALKIENFLRRNSD